jgi:hypothetical protein
MLVIAAVAGVCVSGAFAKPTNPVAPNAKKARPQTSMGPASPGVGDAVIWSDNFDSYVAGTGIIGQGGWQGWAGTIPPPEGFVSNTFSASPTNSLMMTIAGVGTSNTDAVQVFAQTGGKYKFSGKAYVPTNTVAGAPNTGVGYWILLNTYPTFDWSQQVSFNGATNLVTGDAVQAPFPTTVATPQPLVKDQWIPFETSIDLVAGTYDFKYNGTLVVQGGNWGLNLTLQALDCYSDSMVEMYYDDLVLESVVACYPDCNGDTLLTVGDFGCFQTKFVQGDPYADCNGDTLLTVGDFGCFQTKFVQGCAP